MNSWSRLNFNVDLLVQKYVCEVWNRDSGSHRVCFNDFVAPLTFCSVLTAFLLDLWSDMIEPLSLNIDVKPCKNCADYVFYLENLELFHKVVAFQFSLFFLFGIVLHDVRGRHF